MYLDHVPRYVNIKELLGGSLHTNSGAEQLVILNTRNPLETFETAVAAAAVALKKERSLVLFTPPLLALAPRRRPILKTPAGTHFLSKTNKQTPSNSRGYALKNPVLKLAPLQWQQQDRRHQQKLFATRSCATRNRVDYRRCRPLSPPHPHPHSPPPPPPTPIPTPLLPLPPPPPPPLPLHPRSLLVTIAVAMH
uniref:Uncharacterized protein n=1 Tax=Vespula pensylvanica TaxID=30213 RepID=A0A834NRP0_VESPE|nr:hypothetical protein H0235_011251 [Vespula pensylvanica]